MFHSAYVAVQKYFRHGPWYHEYDMRRTGHATYWQLTSLQAFWPGLQLSMSGERPYHKSCYESAHHPKCDVCNNFIPTNAAGLIEYRAHPFWMQKYCPSHEQDKTPRCCSCERMEPRDTQYLVLDDGRKLCLECLDSEIMDTHECQTFYLEIQEFYEGLNMKVQQQVPVLLVERQALNEAMGGEKNGHHHLLETRGLCLSEEQTISRILKRPKIGEGYRITDAQREELENYCKYF